MPKNGGASNPLYINIYDYRSKDYPFNIFIGGRGTGKTYSALSGFTGDNSQVKIPGKFLYMRRRQDDIEVCADTDKGEGANPFKSINTDFNHNIGIKAINKRLYGIYHRQETEGKMLYVNPAIGYGVALSTISGIRGMDFSDVSDIFYDEFIPEPHVPKIKNEAKALLNAYETVCRNRELSGRDAVYLNMAANSDDIYNPIFIELGVIDAIERALSRGKRDVYFPDRGLAIHILQSTPAFLEAKSKTALYRLTQGTAFADMALNNNFVNNDFTFVEHRKLTGFVPICSYGSITIYRKKGDRLYYACYSPSQCQHYDIKVDADRIAFRRRYALQLQGAYIDGFLTFESYAIKRELLEVIL